MKRKWMASMGCGLLLAASVLGGCSSNSASSGGKTTINVWGMGEEAKSLPKMAEEFEKANPDIDVKVQAIPWETAHDKLLTAVASKNGPDVLQMGTTWVPEFASANALMDLTPYIDKYPEFAQDKFFDGSIETTKADGKTVGIPWYVDTRVLFYRTDLLKAAGYSEAPKTWEELSDAALKLSKRGEGKYGITLDPKEQTLSFMFARQNGSELLDAENKPLFNKPDFIEAVNYIDSFYKNGSNAPPDSGLDIVQAFKGDGIIPMFISGPWMVKMINDQAPDLKGKWATAVMPKKENNTSVLGGCDLTVFQYTKHKEEALKFMAFMSKPETQVKWLKMTNALPAAKEAWNDPSLKEDQNYKTFGDQMVNAKPMPGVKQWEPLAQSYLTTFEKIYRTGADPQREMDAFNKKAEEMLKK
ncbi:sugar ABC transporter substrate-binding protein [Metabacillus sp. GX 13764]|uniref:sugar ABC transporter substrate-binding protein n=1 Tax=Metabacillus kandeliae TaxID=2900151 RepID=UPI001E291A91|nr:sugar ABC transporter substrate-binding protein [Metabacillus kandeliae]MCD7035152.1 sugar ABC transporter substrate-binding protein [Metabacillus kandeliae]